MDVEKIYASIFKVTPNNEGTYDIAFDVNVEGKPTTIRLIMVSQDRHAADTMAVAFNRVVSDVAAG